MDGEVTLGRGARCSLVAPTLLREPEMERAINDSRDAHAPWVFHGSARAYFDKLHKGRTIGLFVIDTADDALASVINLNEPVGGGFASAYLGYFTFVAKLRKGLMKEGLSLALDYAFAPLGFHRLEANIQPGNQPSIGLVESLGFRLEGFSPKYLKIGGEWRDHHRYAILADEWTSAKRLQSR